MHVDFLLISAIMVHLNKFKYSLTKDSDIEQLKIKLRYILAIYLYLNYQSLFFLG